MDIIANLLPRSPRCPIRTKFFICYKHIFARLFQKNRYCHHNMFLIFDKFTVWQYLLYMLMFQIDLGRGAST